MTRSLPLYALAIVPALAGCGIRPSNAGPAPADRSPPLAVKTADVVVRPLPRSLTLTGTLVAHRESQVAANAMGKVLATYVERGARVAAGAPLLRLDRRTAALAEVEARSHASVAETQRAQAEEDCARAARLFAEGAIHQAEHDRLQTQCKAAAYSAEAAGARQRLAGRTLADLVVRAPFSGMIADRFVTAGEYVRPDSRVVTLVEVDPLRLELSVPEHALGAVAPGTEVSFRVAAYPDVAFTGRVRHIGATVRRATRDLLVEALVPNKDGRLRPGMFAVADVRLGETTLPVVPAAAVRASEGSGPDRVFVVAAGRAEERLVQLGPRDGDDLVAVTNGLRAGERVVIAPPRELRDGAPVK